MKLRISSTGNAPSGSDPEEARSPVLPRAPERTRTSTHKPVQKALNPRRGR
jgi:hypothetical protein